MTTQNLRHTRSSLLVTKKVTIVQDVYADVIGSVAREFGFPVSKITCKRRTFDVVMARNMACYILHTTFKQKASQIAPLCVIARYLSSKAGCSSEIPKTARHPCSAASAD